MNLFAMIDQSGAAMQVERMRAEVVAANMANAETTRTANGTPYRRQHIVFTSANGDTALGGFAPQMTAAFRGQSGLISPDGWRTPIGGDITASGTVAPGVRIAAVVQDNAPPLKRYDPSHPDADAEGYVSYPDINPLTEMVDLMGATRAYGLNASAVQAEKSMIASALEIAK